MQVSVNSTGTLERQVSVEVPEDRISGKVAEKIVHLARTTRVDGFRPGKVPRKVIERRYGAQVRQEVIGEVLQMSFQEALQQESLRPAGEPTIDPLEAEPGAGLRYTATFEVYPEVSLAAAESLAVEKPVCEIATADVDAMVEKLREQRKQWQPVERAAAQGDRLTVDFTGYMDGEAFEGGAAEDFSIEIGAGQLIEGFEDGLVGKAAGDAVTLELSFPEDYGREEMAGKPVRFEVTVKDVNETVLPPLDEAFFESFGVTEGGLEALRTEVRGNMEREKEQALRARLRDNLMTALAEAVTLDLPKALIASESQRMAGEMRQRLGMQGIPEEHLGSIAADHFTEQAERRVKLGLIIAEIIQTNGLSADPAAVRERIEALAAGYEDPAAVMNWYFEDRRRLGEIESAVLEDAACDWLLEKATVTERNVSFDGLMNSGQTA